MLARQPDRKPKGFPSRQLVTKAADLSDRGKDEVVINQNERFGKTRFGNGF